MNKQIDKTISHIKELERRLGEADNNLRYIKVLQALKHSLDSLLLQDITLQKEYQSIYTTYFHNGCGFSFYDRVCNSILEYKYGNRPF